MLFRLILTTLVILSPFALFAHGSHGTGFMGGFTHPIFGLDHAVTILGIGVLSYLKNKSKWYFIFLPFLIALIVGGLLGIGKEATFVIEKFIAFSVLLTGFAILLHEKINPIILAISLAVFGFVHGFAHGAEIPEDTTVLEYVSGYSLGAILMAAIGMIIARQLSGNKEERNVYLVGGVIVGCALMILLG